MQSSHAAQAGGAESGGTHQAVLLQHGKHVTVCAVVVPLQRHHLHRGCAVGPMEVGLRPPAPAPRLVPIAPKASVLEQVAPTHLFTWTWEGLVVSPCSKTDVTITDLKMITTTPTNLAQTRGTARGACNTRKLCRPKPPCPQQMKVRQ